MKKLFLGIISLMSLLILSCAGGAGGDSSSDSGRVVIAGSRAASQKSDLENFVLKGSLNGGSSKTLKTWETYEEIAGCVIELDVGSWNFSLEGQYAGSKTYFYAGSTTAEIKGGEDTTVSFLLRNQGFLPSEAGVNDRILSNGYACEPGESINGATVTGVVISAGGSGGVVVLNTNFIGGAAGYTPLQMVALVNSLGDGWRLPDVAELNIIHGYILDGSLSSLIALPNTGYILSSTKSGSSYQLLYAAGTVLHTGSDTGGCGICSENGSPGGGSTPFHCLAVKSF